MKTQRRGVTLRGQWRLLAPALGCWACVAALIHFPGSALVSGLISAVVGLGALLFLGLRNLTFPSRPEKERPGSRQRHSWVAPMLLVVCAAILLLSARISGEEHARSNPALVAAAEGVSAVRVEVTLSEYPSVSLGYDGEERGWVRAAVTQLEAEPLNSPVPIMLWLPRAAPHDWGPGTRVVAKGTLERSPPESNVAFEARVMDFDLDTQADRHGVFERVARVAANLRIGLREASSLQRDAELVPGFAVGDTSLVPESLAELMRESSLTHLTAVSGANCGLVVGACVVVAARLGCGRRLRIVIAAGGLAFFVVLVGPDASVQRAGIMAAVLLISGFGGKRGRALPSLGLAVLILLVNDPWQSIHPGFALSVVATGGILLLATPVTEWMRVHLKLPRLLALPFAVACVAQFACAPLLLLLQPGISLGGVVANVLAAPAAPAGTALGMLALITLPVHSGVGALGVWLAAWPARWVEAAGHLSVALPGHMLSWPAGWGGAVLLALVEALICVALMLRAGRLTDASGRVARSIQPWGGAVILGPMRLRITVQVTAAVAAGVLVAITVVVPISVKMGVPRDWMLVACDIGQGDALLIRDPHAPSNVMLVDTGDDPVKLTACLDTFGVRKLSVVVLTHDDRDHVGAVSAVLARAEEVIVAPPSREQAELRPLIAEIEASDTPVRIGSIGMGGGDASGFAWRIVGPAADQVPSDTNAASLVLSVSIQNVGVLLLGDTGEEEQRWLSRTYPNLSAEIVKVAHHGSRDQFLGLYQQLGSSIALVSVGENRYGHPNSALLRELSGVGAFAYRTDELGSIALSMRGGGEVEVWSAGTSIDADVGSSR